MSNIKELFKKELKFIDKIKNEKHKRLMIVAFMNYPNQLKILLIIIESMIRSNEWTNDLKNQFFNDPESVLKTINIDYENKKFKFDTDNPKAPKYTLQKMSE